jgi:TrmH family RNA methyltransferase
MITSLQNPRVKNAVKLRDGRQRQRQGRILIDGARELRRAIEAGVELLEIFVCPPLCQSDDARAVLARWRGLGVKVWEVSPRVFEKLAFGSREEGVLGIARMPDTALERLRLPETPLVAVLEGVEKPGNLGAVLRSADGAGVSALIAADPRTDLYNPNAIRASLGTIFTVPLASASTAETLPWLRQRGLAVYAARVDARTLYTDVDFRRPSAIVLGSEAQGLSGAWSADWIAPVRLPMLGVADSLNVSVAAAVMFYEALRQRSRG